MTFHGEQSPETYAKLVECSLSNDTKHSIVSLAGVDPGYGLKALKIQDRILEFLVDCCRAILQHVRDPMLAQVAPNLGPPKPAPLKTANEAYASIQSAANEVPFRVPAQVDFQRILALLTAEKDQLEERIWTLRESPEIFAEILKDNSDHAHKLIDGGLDGKKVVPHQEEDGHTAKFWNVVILKTLDDAYSKFARCSELLRLVKRLQDAVKDGDDLKWPMQSVTTGILDAYKAVRYFLGRFESEVGRSLAMAIAVSPSLRETIELLLPKGSDEGNVTHVLNISTNDKDRATQLFVELLRILFTKEEFRVRSLHVVLDDLGRLTEKDKGFQALVSSKVGAAISTLLVIAGCQRQLYHFRPWTWMVEQEAVADEALRAAYDIAYDWAMHMGALNDLHKLGAPTHDRFRTPTDHRRTHLNVLTLRTAERQLDEFWAFVDKTVLNKQGKTYHDLVAGYRGINREIRRTPAWNERKSTSSSKDLVEYNYIPIPETKHAHETQTTGAFDRTFIPKAKENRHSTADIGDGPVGPNDHELNNDEGAVPEPVSPLRVITIDRRTQRVIDTLFFSPLSEKPPGKISWTEFVRAMTKIGFAVERVGGSVWHFNPDKELTGVEAPINFHDPHRSRLKIHKARDNGHRLTTKYGWTADTFVLE